MTTAEKMRSKILDLAIRGRLIAHDPHDEPASTLLAQISAEKKKATEKKGKKHTPPVPIPDDEIPFEIPEGWAWVRLGDVSDVQLGKMLDRAKSNGKPFPYLANASVRWNDFDLANLKQMSFTDEEIPKFALCRGDILMCEGGVPGRCAVWQLDDSPIKYQKAVHRIRVQHWLPEFCCLYFAAIQGSHFFATFFTGTTIKHLPRERLLMIPIPLPPLAEQRRIVAKVDTLLGLVAKMGAAEAGLRGAASRIDRKLLDLAIRGALVPQDSCDEPASALLERICAEKKKAAGKKGKKHTPPVPIPDDEIPFEIPEGWAWTRLGEVSTYGECVNVLAQDLPCTTWALDLEEIEKGTGRLLVRRTVGEKNVVGTRHAFSRGMILYSRLRTYLNKVLIADEDGVCSSEMIPFDVYGGISPEYIRHVLMSDYALHYTAEKGYGVKMPRLGTDDARKLPIPLPPLAEQRRIVKKVKAVRATLAPLKDEL